MRNKYNYLVAVFKDNKNCGLYYSEDLSDLPVIRAMHRHCELQISNLCDVVMMREEEAAAIERQKQREFEKGWSFRIKCVETGQVYRSIRDCSLRKGLPYKRLYAAVFDEEEIDGLHFVIDKDGYRKR